jgi:hypothetical protein
MIFSKIGPFNYEIPITNAHAALKNPKENIFI